MAGDNTIRSKIVEDENVVMDVVIHCPQCGKEKRYSLVVSGLITDITMAKCHNCGTEYIIKTTPRPVDVKITRVDWKEK